MPFLGMKYFFSVQGQNWDKKGQRMTERLVKNLVILTMVFWISYMPFD